MRRRSDLSVIRFENSFGDPASKESFFIFLMNFRFPATLPSPRRLASATPPTTKPSSMFFDDEVEQQVEEEFDAIQEEALNDLVDEL